MPDAPSRSVLIVLAYLWPLALVPLLVEKRDREVRWHARHGLVLMAAEVVAAAALVGLGMAASIAAPWVASLLIVLVVIFWFGMFAVHALAALRGLAGSRLLLPGVSRLADRF
jgi:hypothetical protein